MLFVKNSIRFTNKYIKENVIKYIWLVWIAFVISGMATFFLMKSVPEGLNELLPMISDMIQSKDVITETGKLSFWGVFFNNLRACSIISILGLIPFFFLSILFIISNSAILSIVLAFVSVYTDESVIMAFIKYILPHGIVEIPALVIAGALGTKLCAFMCRKIFRKAKDEKFVNHIKGLVGTFVIYIIPLLLAAAFIEAVVLDLIYL